MLNKLNRIFGTFGLSIAAAITSSAQTLTVLHSFQNTDGANPFAGVVQASDGNFYGTTYGTGSGGGVVYQMTPAGTLTVLHAFCSQTNCTDGALPVGKLVQGTDGNLYGTTAGGGANNRGTVFQITLSGSLTTLYNFCNQRGCSDGSQPYAGLIQASDGNFYGTTRFGGANSSGTVFSIGSGGTLLTLYSFCPQTGCPDGDQPNAALVQATNGNLYGTTLYGGASSGDGTVFEITTGGAFTPLHAFCSQTGCPDGAGPTAPLIQDSDGNLYGTTQYGGANNNNGTVFSITPSGKLTTLYSFCAQAGCTDGQGPTGSLLQAEDGNLYGTTDAGGIGYGTIFKTTTGGMLTTLYSFPNEGVGAEPYAGLIQGTSGEFYGTTFIGGAAGYGEVYSFFVQAPAPKGSPCDINKDGVFNVSDVQLLMNQALGLASAVSDLNGSEAVTVVDVQIDIDAALDLGCLVANAPVTPAGWRTLQPRGATAHVISPVVKVHSPPEVPNEPGTLGGRPYLGDAGRICDLVSAVACGTNDIGKVVGSAYFDGGSAFHAFLYNGMTLIDLGTLGGSASQADAINNSGLIVGWADTASGKQHAFLWSSGRMVDLNDFVAIEGDAVLEEATSIDNAGQITANGSDGRIYQIAVPDQLR
jgi:probable HAF family extracellular repeat protein/uncharacterized repeat protein (TIGR03803 family)